MLDGKLVLYENAKCAAMLKNAHRISVKILRRDEDDVDADDPMTMCEVEGRKPNGQTDQAIKYVSLTARDRSGHEYRLRGKALADARAKAETGAKRRLIFPMVGVAGGPAPEELEHARPVIVDGAGRIIENPTEEERAFAADPRLARMHRLPVYEDVEAASPFGGQAPTGPTAEELEPVKRTIPRQSFRPSEDDVTRWQKTWFATVKGTSLDSDEARHEFVRGWTVDEDWPKAKQTDSLTTMFRRMTERQAEDFLAHVRALCDDERSAAEEALAALNRDDEQVTEADVEPF
jgi:hypothetical protein